jgi:hypothetical protein
MFKYAFYIQIHAKICMTNMHKYVIMDFPIGNMQIYAIICMANMHVYAHACQYMQINMHIYICMNMHFINM